MSGQREAHFLIQDSRKARQLREKRVAERIQALFSVHLTLTAARAQGEWVTLRGSDENTEKAKKYILSLCTPEMVKNWQSSSTSADLLFSETSRLRDDLEREFQTVILPSSSTQGCIHVQGSQADVQNTLFKIASLMSPLEQDCPPNNHQYPTPPSPPTSLSPSTSPPLLPQSQSTYQPNYPLATTAGSFPASPPLAPSLSSTQDGEQQLRGTLNHMPDYTTDRHRQSESERRDLLKNIATDIERDGCMVPRGLDSAQREQTIQYFVSLNFPREKTEAVINSIGWESDYDDILQRLVNICTPPSSHYVAKAATPRPMSFTGEAVLDSSATLRPVVIDGSNVAMRGGNSGEGGGTPVHHIPLTSCNASMDKAFKWFPNFQWLGPSAGVIPSMPGQCTQPSMHGNGRVFSCRGIELAVQWFKQRGHQSITVFVPQWRREPPRAEYPITDQDILNQLEVERTLVFTPSRRIGNKKIVCYDDRFIVRLATETGGVIVSNDNFRDLTEENEDWRKTIEQRLVMFTFVNDIFMVAEDPLGRHGPSLNQLLQMEPTKTSAKGSLPADQPGYKICPYGERCTFGKKCRYYHPEREGRVDSVLSARGATASPVSERRLTGGSADLQKDFAAGHSDQATSGSGRRSKSPQKPLTNSAFPSQPGPESRIYVQDPRSYQQEFQGYPPAPQGYLQPPREYCQPQEGQSFIQKPHYLGILPATNGVMSNQPTSLHRPPRHPTPTTPMGTYAARTFPIANLSLPRPRNMTDCIQTDLSPLPPSDFNATGRGGKEEDARSLMPRAPPTHTVPPPHHQPVDPLPGLVSRGDYSAPYPSVPYSTVASCDVHQYDRTPGYPPQHAYHLHSNAYAPTNSYYLPSESPPNPRLHHSPVRNGPQNGLHPLPAMHGGSNAHSHSNRHSAELTSLPENQLYTASPAYHIHSSSSYQLQNLPRRQSMPTVPDYRVAYPYLNTHAVRAGSNPSSVYMDVKSDNMPYTTRGVTGKGEDSGDVCRNSGSAPELNRSDQVSNINWSLFKKAQAVLPNHEEKIMTVMLRYPSIGDLEQLIHLVQLS